MRRLSLSLCALGLALAFAGEAAAQTAYNRFPSYSPYNSRYYPSYVSPSYYPTPNYSYPVYVSPSYVSGYTPWGGLNTTGTTVYNSAYSPWRTASMYNGTLHYVNQPVYNSYGQITGWRSGEAWRDSVTGQQHFQGNVVTPNGAGGWNNQNVFRSANPMAGRGATTRRALFPRLANAR